MTLLKDLEIITNSVPDAAGIDRAVSAVADDRGEAYRILIDVAQRADIGIVRMLALLMKYEARDSEQEAPDAIGHSANVRLHDHLQDLERAFSEVSDSLYRSIDRSLFFHLLCDMSLLGLHRVHTDSAALTYVSDQWRNLSEQLASADESLAERFFAAKRRWININERFASLLRLRRGIAAHAESVQREFLARFADDFLAERAELSRLEVARLRLSITRKNPGVAAAGIEDLLRRQQARQDDANNTIRLNAGSRFWFVNPRELRDKEKDFKRASGLLRKLAMLTHPDRVSRFNLGWAQREQLNAIWRESYKYRALKDDVSAFARTADHIERQIQMAERILALSDIEDLDATLTVHGETLAEQADWLEYMNELLVPQLVSLRIEVHQMGAQPELNYFQAIIDAPQPVQEEERAQWKTNAAIFREESTELERTLQNLLTSHA